MVNVLGKEIIDRLNSVIENPQSELVYSNEFELLIAVMLSAQCTDKRVNMITSELFAVYNRPEQLMKLSQEELESYIKSCNYYKTKAKNIIEMSKILVEKFGGKVPQSHQELISLPGVGNKTANVVQAVAYNMQALAVDTHVLRVSNRLGFSNSKNPSRCEEDLKKIFKDFDWVHLHHLLLLFGRYFCTARKPKCDGCILKDICKKSD